MALMKRTLPHEVGSWRSELPFVRGLERMQHVMNRAFEEFLHDDFPAAGSFLSSNWLPAVDIEESEDAYIFKAELPGLSKEDIKISLDSNILTLRGEKKVENDRKKGNFHRIERTSGVFERSFMLPGSVNSDAIDAAFADGILTVRLPKKERAEEKLIEVQVK